MNKLIFCIIALFLTLPVYSAQFKYNMDCKVRPEGANCILKNDQRQPLRCKILLAVKTEEGRTKTSNHLSEVMPSKVLKLSITPPNYLADPAAFAHGEATCETLGRK